MSAEAISFTELPLEPVPIVDVDADVIYLNDSQEIDVEEVLVVSYVSADIVKDYLRQLKKFPLINAEQEVEASRQIEAGVFAEYLLDNPAENTKYSEVDLLEITRLGLNAKELMVNSNLRLVVRFARRYIGLGMDYMDLISEGNLGLNRAVEKFDYTKGIKFSTYATWWIRQSITHAMADQINTIRIPAHMVESLNAYRRAATCMALDLGREPTDDELREELKVSKEKFADILATYKKTKITSLNMPYDVDTDSEFGDFIENDDLKTVPDYAYEETEKAQLVRSMITHSLTEKEQAIILMRLGFMDEEYTLEQVGKIYGVTSERARQLQVKVLNKLRNDPYLADMFKGYI